MSSMGHSIISLVLVAVLPINALAATLLPCCCAESEVGERSSCCAAQDAASRCCAVQERAAKCPLCDCQHSPSHRCNGSTGCCCVQSAPPLVVPPAAPEIERPQDHFLYPLSDETALNRSLPGSRLSELMRGQYRPVRPSLMVLFCSWLK
jgi:hypothetical protein